MEIQTPKMAEQNLTPHVNPGKNPNSKPKTENNSDSNPDSEMNSPNFTIEEISNSNPDVEHNHSNPNPEQHANSNPKSSSESTEADGQGVKRKHGGDDPNWKTSLCSYFRRQAQDCRHGDKCRYAHGERELRPRPDSSWDPTSERAKKLLWLQENEEKELCASEDPKELLNEVPSGGNGSVGGLSKCIIYLPKGWFAGNLKKLLDSLELPYSNVKKKKGATVGFITFSSAEHVKLATEKLNGHSIHNRHLKVADVPQSRDKQQEKHLVEEARGDQHVDDSNALNSQKTESQVFSDGIPVECQDSATDRLTVKRRSARDAVTPLAHMTYDEQLSFKKKSVMQILKKLTRNARKTCPSGVTLPEWIPSARNQGGLPCKFEGILNSPVVNGYRNKCEFTIGHSTDGEIVVGFLLGNFREGFTAVEEPTNCPNVSASACKYALIFQNFVRSSSLPVWNKNQNGGFWRLFTVREGRAPNQVSPNQVSNSGNNQPDVAEVMLIAQVCSAGDKQDLRSSEFKRMAQELVIAAMSASPPLPLTGLLVQDHLGISNAAPPDAPLFTVPLPVVVEGNIVEDDCKEFEGIIHEYINNLCFSISPTAFFQINTLAAERLYSLAGDWAALSLSTLLFDVCCGTGTIGLTLANRAGMVIGIEMNAPAVADAQRNAEINGIKNCRFVCAKAEDVMDSLLKEYLGMPVESESDSLVNISDKRDGTIRVDCAGQYEEKESNSVLANEENVKADTGSRECEKLDKKSTSSLETPDTNDYSEIKDSNSPKQFTDVVAIVDPPRSGLHPGVIKAIRTHSRLRRLVYISCNPETLVANAIELCAPSTDISEKVKGNKGGYRHMGNFGLARQRAKSMPISEPFCPVKAMAVDLFPHTPHCEMVLLFER